MTSSRLSRAIAILLLLGMLFGLLVWHGSLEPEPSVWALPGTEELATDYDGYLGARVSVGGPVVSTDPVVIAAEYGVDGVLRLRIVGLDGSVEAVEGATLRVYGIVEPDRTVRALNAFAVPQRGLWYTWSVSFLAGLWVLGRIVRYWGLDRSAWALGRRAWPLGVRERGRNRLAGGDGDA